MRSDRRVGGDQILKPSCRTTRMAQFRGEAVRGLRRAGPSLLTINELSSIDGYHFMAMPYVEGITMREVIRGRFARLSGAPTTEIHPLVSLDDPDYLPAMTRILAEATRALARAHEQRIAHRDIKPANILLNNRRPDGVYLCDFGLGRDLEIATSEQMQEQGRDPDVHGAGTTAARHGGRGPMRHLFDGGHALRGADARAALPDPRSRDPPVPPGVPLQRTRGAERRPARDPQGVRGGHP